MSLSVVSFPALPLTPDWRKWISECLMLGYEQSYITTTLLQSGFDVEAISNELCAIHADPCFHAGMVAAQRLRKLTSTMNILDELAGLSSGAAGIERRSNVSPEEFLECYYAANRPVILTDLMQNWGAPTKWTPEYLKDVCGHETIEIMGERECDARYEINSIQHKRSVRFSDYVDRVMGAGQTNDFYLVANNNFMDTEGGRRLYHDIEEFPGFLNPQQSGCVFFWFGPAGTVTPLHHDTMNIFLAQVRGRKAVRLISPRQTPFVYNNTGVYSEVDCEQPDYETYPLFRSVRQFDLVLEPTETLFLPVGWWHHVRALDVSVSMSFTNVIWPNHYTWDQPSIDRNL